MLSFLYVQGEESTVSLTIIGLKLNEERKLNAYRSVTPPCMHYGHVIRDLEILDDNGPLLNNRAIHE